MTEMCFVRLLYLFAFFYVTFFRLLTREKNSWGFFCPLCPWKLFRVKVILNLLESSFVRSRLASNDIILFGNPILFSQVVEINEGLFFICFYRVGAPLCVKVLKNVHLIRSGKVNSLILRIQSNSVITNSRGPSENVRYNRETL